MSERRNFAKAALGSLIGGCLFVTPLVSAIQRAWAATTSAPSGTNPGSIRTHVSVTEFGARGNWNGVNGTNDTVAFEAALASGKTVYVPPGKYLLSSLAPWTNGGHLYGDGRSSLLVFDTEGPGIKLETRSPAQRETVYVHDLSFTNVNHIPAAFVLNNFYVNTRFERLYFSDCAAQYCIDNQSGYGTKISDCVFSDVIGNGIRFQQSVDLMRYSFAAAVVFSDFTRISGHAIDIDGCNVLNVIGGVIESCAKGIVANYRGGIMHGQNQSGNINLQGVFFEANSGHDIELNSTSDYWASCTMQACTMIERPSIYLGAKSKLAIIGCSNPEGERVRVIGASGSDARATLLRSHNYIQDGDYQWFDADTYYDTVSTAHWYADAAQPEIGNGILTSRWSQLGKRATVELSFRPGTTTRFGAGNYSFTDSFLTLVPMAPGESAVGIVIMYDESTKLFHTGIAEIEGNRRIRVSSVDGRGPISPTVPFTWSPNDYLKITLSYRC